MKLPLTLSLAAFLLILPVGAQVTKGDGTAAPFNPLSVFVPKAFQKHPRVDFNVITEMTPAGRGREQPTMAKPQYYQLHAMGYRKLGQGAPAGEHPPEPEGLMNGMRDALAANGYVESTHPDQVPDLVVITYWGSYTSAGWDAEAINSEMAAAEANPEGPADTAFNVETADSLLPLVLTDLRKRQELLERAALVGGVRFASELQKVLNEEVNFADQRQNEERLGAMMAAAGGDGGFAAGAVLAFQSMNPFYRFKNRDNRTNYLVEQSFGSMYFVVASAYDFKTMSEPARLLLWRTKMTVDSNGVAMQETLPRLIANAAPYFGKDMEMPETVRTRIDREGSVEIGDAVVVEGDVE